MRHPNLTAAERSHASPCFVEPFRTRAFSCFEWIRGERLFPPKRQLPNCFGAARGRSSAISKSSARSLSDAYRRQRLGRRIARRRGDLSAVALVRSTDLTPPRVDAFYVRGLDGA